MPIDEKSPTFSVFIPSQTSLTKTLANTQLETTSRTFVPEYLVGIMGVISILQHGVLLSSPADQIGLIATGIMFFSAQAQRSRTTFKTLLLLIKDKELIQNLTLELLRRASAEDRRGSSEKAVQHLLSCLSQSRDHKKSNKQNNTNKQDLQTKIQLILLQSIARALAKHQPTEQPVLEAIYQEVQSTYSQLRNSYLMLRWGTIFLSTYGQFICVTQ